MQRGLQLRNMQHATGTVRANGYRFESLRDLHRHMVAASRYVNEPLMLSMKVSSDKTGNHDTIVRNTFLHPTLLH